MLVISSVMLALSIPVDSTLIREFTAVLAASPIERLESHAGSPTVTDVVLADIDADGRLDAVVSIRPTLRQTPTLLIYRRADSGAWERVREGLAPGRLRPVSGRFVDTHVHRVGLDMTAGDGSPEANQRVLNAGASSEMSLVAYRGFLHADMRVGATLLVDLSTWPLPSGTENTCEDFEFSLPAGVVVGSLGDAGEVPHLVALTEEDITVYRVEHISPEGRLALKSWLLPRPADVTAVTRAPDGTIQLVQGESRSPLRVP